MHGEAMSGTALTVWEPNPPVEIAPDASAGDIAMHARALTERDMRSIATAFDSGSYEMVSTFVWTRAITGLKKQIASLGMEFVGQMLGRSDIDDDSDPATTIGEHDAISLAEDLGMINTTEALRLKHSLELVAHFADPEVAAQEQMNHEEAVNVLRSCVVSILGNPHIKPPIQFAELRQALEQASLQSDDERVAQIAESPYFIQRTTLSVLLSMLKTAMGAQLEHAVGNTNVILPRIWPNLRKPERWQVGQTYAEVHAAGKHAAAVGLKNALAVVQGFDFVPETLRSDTFAKAAHRVMEAHFAMDNYYKEAAPMQELASLGTTIPRPAFPVCMTAILCVRLGNYFGTAWSAQESAAEMLKDLRKEQWEYYLNECLAGDKTILDKIENANPANRWIALASEFSLLNMRIADEQVKRLVAATTVSAVRSARKLIRNNSR
ncbi:MAG: hypothetical protein R3C59_12430 [Planctomycetaceae bacterium]